jgi:hypothetical protein
MHRYGTLDEQAELIFFLASDAAPKQAAGTALLSTLFALVFIR